MLFEGAYSQLLHARRPPVHPKHVRWKVCLENALTNPSLEYQRIHTGKCIRRFAGIYAYCRYFIDRKW